MVAPTLLTDRLRLDGHRPDDLETLVAIWSRPEVYGFIGDGKPRDREDRWLRLLRSIGQWSAFGYGAWVVRDRSTGAIVGEVGLIEARRAIEPALDAPEMSWMVAAEAQGRGLAREALDAALGWADANGIGRTVCIIDPDNTASIRLAGRVGYVAIGMRRYPDKPVALFARTTA